MEDVEGFYEFHFSLLIYPSFLFTHDIGHEFEKVNWQNCLKFLVFEGVHSLYKLAVKIFCH